MTDPSHPPPLPPGLDLADDDVIESFETVEENDEPVVEGFGADDPVRVSGHDGVGTRREARERALALLYEAEQKSIDPPALVLDTLPVPAEAYAAELVNGVSDHLGSLDELLGRYSVGWTVVRMPAVDRAVLRLATYELAHTDVPIGAIISEAVELAKRYSTDESHSFVNGLLSRLAAELRSEQ